MVTEKIYHLDLKPDNIMLKDNFYKLTDFGISRVKTYFNMTLILEKKKPKIIIFPSHLIYTFPESRTTEFDKNVQH